MVLHNSEITDTIRSENDKFTEQWVASTGLLGCEPVTVSLLDVADKEKEDSSPFMVVWLKNIERLCQMLPAQFDYKTYSMIDVGCGSGISTCYFYTNFSFSSCSGFDFSKDLISLAKLNQRIVERKFPKDNLISFQVSDAQTYAIEKKKSVLFMFNPFGAKTLSAFIQNNIETLRETQSYFLYANDLHLDVLLPYIQLLNRDEKFNLSVGRFVN